MILLTPKTKIRIWVNYIQHLINRRGVFASAENGKRDFGLHNIHLKVHGSMSLHFEFQKASIKLWTTLKTLIRQKKIPLNRWPLKRQPMDVDGWITRLFKRIHNEMNLNFDSNSIYHVLLPTCQQWPNGWIIGISSWHFKLCSGLLPPSAQSSSVSALLLARQYISWSVLYLCVPLLHPQMFPLEFITL